MLSKHYETTEVDSRTKLEAYNFCIYSFLNSTNSREAYLIITIVIKVYWKEKETHILNFWTSDLYWEHYFS